MRPKSKDKSLSKDKELSPFQTILEGDIKRSQWWLQQCKDRKAAALKEVYTINGEQHRMGRPFYVEDFDQKIKSAEIQLGCAIGRFQETFEETQS